MGERKITDKKMASGKQTQSQAQILSSKELK
jgi:hypothetical protein